MFKCIKVLVFVFLFAITAYGQINSGNQNLNSNQEPELEKERLSLRGKVAKDSVAPIALYKIISIKNDTIAVDTTQSVQKYYKFNYLRKDNFGLLAFNNEGQTYNRLTLFSKESTIVPDFGFRAKQIAYLDVDDVYYYSAPTPFTELYYKSVTKQGQNLDAFITLNTSKNLNMSIAYKGLRSVGRYINQLSSTGNFRYTASYTSPNKRYNFHGHFTSQDISNEENGGIRDLDLFESSKTPYNKRERLNVYFRDASTLLKGNRVFFKHQYQLNNSFKNGLLLTHEFKYENKSFKYKQIEVDGQYDDANRYGDAFSNSIDNVTKFNTLSNVLGIGYKNDDYGHFEAIVNFNSLRYHYNSITHIGSNIVGDHFNRDIVMLGGRYGYRNNSFKGNLLFLRSLSSDESSELTLDFTYTLNDVYGLKFGYQRMEKLANISYYLYQSDYVNYNWQNDFKNEKSSVVHLELVNPFLSLSASYHNYKDKLYFSNDALSYNSFGIPDQILVSPKQYASNINFFSVQGAKDFKFGKFGLDNTILYQHVEQSDNVINLPSFVTRNTFYYTDAFFSKALKFQTGISFKYFSEYYADDYNPVLGDFFVQDKVKVGNYPVFDLFINMKIRTAQIYVVLEHFNSGFTGYNYYTAPNYPYRDFTFRFGLVWNFFS